MNDSCLCSLPPQNPQPHSSHEKRKKKKHNRRTFYKIPNKLLLKTAQVIKNQASQRNHDSQEEPEEIPQVNAIPGWNPEREKKLHKKMKEIWKSMDVNNALIFVH